MVESWENERTAEGQVVQRDEATARPPLITYPSLIYSFGGDDHPFQTLGDDGNDSSLCLRESLERLAELHRPALIHGLKIL